MRISKQREEKEKIMIMMCGRIIAFIASSGGAERREFPILLIACQQQI
jgi:hypothetical protein